MADVLIDKYRVKVVRQGTTPANPGNVTTDPLSPVNPGGSGGTFFGVGAGLSLDSANKVQLGNESVGVVNVTDSSEFPNGLLFKVEEVVSGATFSTQSYLLNGDASLFASQLDPLNDFNKFTVISSYINGASLSLNYNKVSTGGFGYAQFQTRLIGGFNPLVNELEARFNIYDETNFDGSGISIVRDPITGVYTLKVFDEQGQKGLIYDGDYESNFTARSLVTKQYVDGEVTSVDVLGTLLTGYTVGSNTAIAATDSILVAFGKVQGQINSQSILKCYNSYEDRVSNLVTAPTYSSISFTPTEGSLTFQSSEMGDGATYEMTLDLLTSNSNALNGLGKIRFGFAGFNSDDFLVPSETGDNYKHILKIKMHFYGVTDSARNVFIDFEMRTYAQLAGGEKFLIDTRSYFNNMTLSVNTTSSKDFTVQNGGATDSGGNKQQRVAIDYLRLLKVK